MKDPPCETLPPSPAEVVRSYELMEKEAAIDLFWVIETEVDRDVVSEMPSPVHPLKEYPVSGVAVIVGEEP